MISPCMCLYGGGFGFNDHFVFPVLHMQTDFVHNILAGKLLGILIIKLGGYGGGICIKTREVGRAEGALFINIKGNKTGCNLVIKIFAGIKRNPAVISVCFQINGIEIVLVILRGALRNDFSENT